MGDRSWVMGTERARLSMSDDPMPMTHVLGYLSSPKSFLLWVCVG
jgi:hypothetical protein